ncbi:MAG: 4Fe-4S binding protein [Candidatus Aenigmarchaeota archaeon]|nr:4Fe-4S binding protein [Candidatus Aenigmarchaeota archaeon]
MLANYGYKDGSGEYFITIDTDLCNACKKCVSACQKKVLKVNEDPYDPLSDKQVALVMDQHRKNIKYVCAPCKPVNRDYKLPCVEACEAKAIKHSW